MSIVYILVLFVNIIIVGTMETVLSMVVDFYKFNGVVKVLQSHSSRGNIFRLHISGCKS